MCVLLFFVLFACLAMLICLHCVFFFFFFFFPLALFVVCMCSHVCSCFFLRRGACQVVGIPKAREFQAPRVGFEWTRVRRLFEFASCCEVHINMSCAQLNCNAFEPPHKGRGCSRDPKVQLSCNMDFAAFCLDVGALTFCQLTGFPLNHLQVKLLAGEQKATECIRSS